MPIDVVRQDILHHTDNAISIKPGAYYNSRIDFPTQPVTAPSRNIVKYMMTLDASRLQIRKFTCTISIYGKTKIPISKIAIRPINNLKLTTPTSLLNLWDKHGLLAQPLSAGLLLPNATKA